MIVANIGMSIAACLAVLACGCWVLGYMTHWR